MRCLVVLFCTLLFPVSLLAADKPTITIATYDSFASEWGIGPILKEHFEKTCQCTVAYKSYASSLAMIAGIKSGALDEADILLGFDQITYQLNPFIKNHLGQHHINDGAVFADDKVVAYDYGTIALITTKDTFKNLPTSWDDLVAKTSDHSLILIDPRASTVGQAMLMDLAIQYGDDLDDFLKKLKPKILSLTQGWSSAYALFTQKEGDVVLSYTTSASYHRLIEKDDSKIALLNDGGHMRQIELMGVLKNSKHQELAQSFMSYVLSEEAQNLIPTTQWMFPVKAGIHLPDNYIIHQEPRYHQEANIDMVGVYQKALAVFTRYF